MAEEKNIKALDSIRKQQLEVRGILQELDYRHKELDQIIDRAKRATIDPNLDQDNEDEGEMSTNYCITCGHEIHSRTAIKHMEKCFNKYESQVCVQQKVRNLVLYSPSDGKKFFRSSSKHQLFVFLPLHFK